MVQQGNLVILSIFAVIPLLRGNSDALNQSNLRNFSAYIITGGMALAIGSSDWNANYSLKMHAFSLESKIGTSFSTMGGIEEEFSRPHTLLMIDHHFLPLISGLLSFLLALS